jgi:ribosomal protein L11 methyltransferase
LTPSASGHVGFRIEAPAELRDVLYGELASLGCLGVHEDHECLVVYFGTECEPAAVLALADARDGLRIEGPIPVEAQDWERRWRRGLEPRCIAGLWIRPSWCASRGGPELVIDPRQAFGSGEHASTRLALSLLLQSMQPGDRVLDVGSGSGILALGGLRRGAGQAVAFDIDPVACANAADNAIANRLHPQLYCGTLDALRADARFDVVVANMLSRRLAPLGERLERHTRRTLILSGYLESEAEAVLAPHGGRGWAIVRDCAEEQSGDRWCAAQLAHERDRQ